jgi:hypothetical protein
MQLITHHHRIDQFPTSPLKIHIQARFDQLSEDTDVPPNIVFVEPNDNISSQEYEFIEVFGSLSCYYSKWTRKWTYVLDFRVSLNTSKYTFDFNLRSKTASNNHPRTDRYR